MSQQPTLLTLRYRARLLARQLTALQLRCHSRTDAHRLSVLVAVSLCPIAQQLDELEVLSAGTILNEVIERANRFITALMVLLATTPNTLITAELAPMLSPAIRLLTEAEHQAMEVLA